MIVLPTAGGRVQCFRMGDNVDYYDGEQRPRTVGTTRTFGLRRARSKRPGMEP